MPAPISGGRVTPGVSRQDIFRRLKFVYDFAVVGGAIGVVNLRDESGQVIGLPDRAVIESVTVEDIVAVTSGGAATIAIGTSQSGQGSAVLTATAYTAAPFNAPRTATKPLSTPVVVNNAGVDPFLTVTIAGAAITAGRFLCFVTLAQGE